MYRHGFFLKLKSSRLRFCNKKNRFFGHFQLVSTLIKRQKNKLFIVVITAWLDAPLICEAGGED